MHESKSRVVFTSTVLALLIAGSGNLAIAARSGDGAGRSSMNVFSAGQSMRNPDRNQIELQSRPTLQTRFAEQEQLRSRDQQRLLKIENERQNLKWMYLNREQIQNQPGMPQQQSAGALDQGTLARQEKIQLQERMRPLTQQREQPADQDELPVQQREQIEERIRLLNQQQETLQ